MNAYRQHGIATLWLYLGAGAAMLILISGIVYGVKSYLNDVDERAYQRGKKEVEAVFAKRDNEQLQAALKRLRELEESARAREQEHAQELAVIDAQRQKEINDAKDQRDRDVAAIVAGTLKLRDPGVRSPSTTGSGGGAGSEAGSATCQRDGEAGTQLSDAAAKFLLGFADDADNVVRQLGQAQAVILSQLKACNSGR